jgi:hypothetical protein
MPFDPTLPANGSPIAAAELRTQMNALHDAINTILSAGGVNGAVVDMVYSDPPGSSGSATVSMDGGGVLHFTFSIPQGLPGEVTQGQLSNDLANMANYCIQQSLNQSSNISNSVGTLNTPFSNGEAEILRQKLNELILALRR